MAQPIDGLPKLPLEGPACRPKHALQHALGLDYIVEPVVGVGLLATNGAVIDTKALAEKAPGYCPPQARTLTPAIGIKQF